MGYILPLGAIAPSGPPRTALSENDLKLAGSSFETKDDNDFNVVNANDAML